MAMRPSMEVEATAEGGELTQGTELGRRKRRDVHRIQETVVTPHQHRNQLDRAHRRVRPLHLWRS